MSNNIPVPIVKVECVMCTDAIFAGTGSSHHEVIEMVKIHLREKENSQSNKHKPPPRTDQEIIDSKQFRWEYIVSPLHQLRDIGLPESVLRAERGHREILTTTH